MYDPYDDNGFIAGKSGHGKSSLLLYVLLVVLKDVNRVLWDANHQHGKMLDAAGWKHIKLGDEIPNGGSYVTPDDASKEEFDILIDAAMKRGNVVVAVEEAQEVMSSSATKTVLRWLRTGRNRGVTYLTVTQIPAQLKDSVLGNANWLAIFKLQRPEDTGYIAGWLGLDRSIIPNLRKFEYVFISQDESEPRIFELRPAGTLDQIRGQIQS
jgi:hypothetical protein